MDSRRGGFAVAAVLFMLVALSAPATAQVEICPPVLLAGVSSDVIVYGADFQTGTTVCLVDGSPVDSTVVSSRALVASVPARGPGRHSLTVITKSATSTTSFLCTVVLDRDTLVFCLLNEIPLLRELGLITVPGTAESLEHLLLNLQGALKHGSAAQARGVLSALITKVRSPGLDPRIAATLLFYLELVSSTLLLEADCKCDLAWESLEASITQLKVDQEQMAWKGTLARETPLEDGASTLTMRATFWRHIVVKLVSGTEKKISLPLTVPPTLENSVVGAHCPRSTSPEGGHRIFDWTTREGQENLKKLVAPLLSPAVEPTDIRSVERDAPKNEVSVIAGHVTRFRMGTELKCLPKTGETATAPALGSLILDVEGNAKITFQPKRQKDKAH